ncbi:hypothetical protein [Aquipuribacter sp. MA13-6]|uniref:hypothetical protein n=1 Tax=Aquipuribacter sp. MA13-6 TaxID=3440839 RepID=UPI003EEF412C
MTDGARERVEALAGRVRRLPPPSWTGPTSEAFSTGVVRAARFLDAAADSLARAAAAVRRSGAP